MTDTGSAHAAVSKRLQGALLRIRGDHPFFGTLALFAELRISQDVPTAATDGKVLWFNPDFIQGLEGPSLCGLVAHELLHAALQHGARRGVRDAMLWNVAADIVVNGMIRKDTEYALPKGAVEVPKLAHLSVEDIYEQFQCGRMKAPKLALVDLIAPPGGADAGALQSEQVDQLSRHWRAALQQAGAVARRIGKGLGRLGLDEVRDVLAASQPTIGWKDLLWQFMVATPFDFGGFDRRFVHRKLYLEDAVGETVEVAICVDTSGSIGGPELSAFMAEVQAILDAYPQIKGHLFYADALLYGPYDFGPGVPLPAAKGGGGTDFTPFFNWLAREAPEGREPVAIYLTDGYGSFPNAGEVQVPTLWVVSPGGLESTEFPFGQVARMGTA